MRTGLLTLSLSLSLFLSSTALAASAPTCPTAEALLRVSIECSSKGGKASILQSGNCRKIACTEITMCVDEPVSRQTRLRQLERRAYAGSAEAMYALAVLYYTGQGVTQNDERAFAWFIIADTYGYDIPNRATLERYFARSLSEKELTDAELLIQTYRTKIREVTKPPPSEEALALDRNKQRQKDVLAILDALYRYALDNAGVLPTQIPVTPTEICAGAAAECQGLIDLSKLLQKHLPSIPRDPLLTEIGASTWYFVSRSEAGRLTVSAPKAEQTTPISATR
jgi:hypothetical protein